MKAFGIQKYNGKHFKKLPTLILQLPNKKKAGLRTTKLVHSYKMNIGGLGGWLYKNI